MKIRRLNILVLAATAAMLASCSDTEADIMEEGIPVDVDLAFTFSYTKSTSQTRLIDKAFAASSDYIQILRVVPMNGNTPDAFGEVTLDLEDVYDKTNARFYYSQYCTMISGDDACLVYAKDDRANADNKVTYGSLIAKLPESSNITNTDQILFELEPIYKNSDFIDTHGIPVEASTLAGYLNDVASVEGWQNSQNTELQNLFANFNNHGYNLPGSAASVKKWLEEIEAAAETCKASVDDTEDEILDNVKATANKKIDSINIKAISYPRDINLPDGAAALRWIESSNRFEPQLQTTTLDNINSVARFAYPASLYYFVKSGLLTKDEKVNFANTYTSKDTWATVISDFTDGAIIKGSTKSVALKDPVQFAVAKLEVKLKASDTSLPDGADTPNNISIGTNNFPLKGIIVCGQRPVDFEFKQSTNSNTYAKFIYDSQVEEDVYLSTTETAACNTLVLQSLDGEDVNIILEFENNSDITLECVDGKVYPDTRFYLVGQIAASSGTGGEDGSTGRVFTKDYTTTVNMTVTTLAKAYSVLPSLLTSNLEIGVETTPQWVASTPTVIRLE